MEKYFIIKKGSELYKDYTEWFGNTILVNALVKQFMTENGMETSLYHADNNRLYIVPTEKDVEKFNKVLNKATFKGLRQFRANSKIAKKWVKFLEEKEVAIKQRPYASFYFPVWGRTRSRLFHEGEALYCSIGCQHDFELPDFAKEIKASEFHRVLERLSAKEESK